MADVKVNVLRIIDDSFPVFVECELIDCHGTHHYFIDKLPVVSEYDAVPPCIGAIRCTVMENKENTVVIDTSLPDDIASTNGAYQFEVYQNQVTV